MHPKNIEQIQVGGVWQNHAQCGLKTNESHFVAKYIYFH
jgi:hypothetical protein